MQRLTRDRRSGRLATRQLWYYGENHVDVKTKLRSQAIQMVFLAAGLTQVCEALFYEYFSAESTIYVPKFSGCHAIDPYILNNLQGVILTAELGRTRICFCG